VDGEKHAQWGPGDRGLPDPGEGAAGVRPVWPRQHPVHRRTLRTFRRHQDHLGPSRERRRLHGRRLLPRLGAADGDLHLLRSRIGEPADLAWQRVSRLGAVHGSDRQRADQPVQPRRVPGTLPALSGRLPFHRALLLQEGVSADARRDGAAGGPAGVEDHDLGPPGPGGDRRPLRRLHGVGPRKRRRRRSNGTRIFRAAAAPIPRAWSRPSTCWCPRSGR